MLGVWSQPAPHSLVQLRSGLHQPIRTCVSTRELGLCKAHRCNSLETTSLIRRSHQCTRRHMQAHVHTHILCIGPVALIPALSLQGAHRLPVDMPHNRHVSCCTTTLQPLSQPLSRPGNPCLSTLMKGGSLRAPAFMQMLSPAPSIFSLLSN